MMKLPCIDEEVLADYIYDRLPDSEKDAAEEHLASCDDCLEEFVLANTLLNDSELAAYQPGPAELVRTALREVREKVKNKLSEWLAGLSPPEWIFCYEPSPVRSEPLAKRSGYEDISSGAMFIKKNINHLKTEMYMEKEGDGTARIWIKVFKGSQAAKNVSLTLIRGTHAPFARVLMRDRDYADFKQPFGDYRLMLDNMENKEQSQVSPYLFEISDTGFYEK
jgi:hypothetical protein